MPQSIEEAALSVLDRVRTAIGYRLIVLGQGILPADLRQIERAAHSTGINTLHERVEAIVLDRERTQTRGG